MQVLLGSISNGLFAKSMEEFRALEKEMGRHGATRDLLRDFLTMAHAVSQGFVPPDAKSALANFKVAADSGQGVGLTFCVQAVGLQRAAARLAKQGDFEYDGEDFGILPGEPGKNGVEAEAVALWSVIRKLPQVVLSLPFVTPLRDLLHECVAVSFRDFMDSLYIPSMQISKGATHVDDSVRSQILCVVDPNKCMTRIEAATRVFTSESSEKVLPPSLLLNLFLDLVRALGDRDETWKLTYTPAGGGADRTVDIKPSGDNSMLTLLSLVSEVAVVFGFISQQMAGGDSDLPAIRDHALPPSVRAAVLHVSAWLKKTDLVFRQNIVVSEASEWPIKMQEAKVWHAAACILHASVKRRCVQALASDIEGFAQNLSKNAPAYNHIISDDQYLKPLAKRFLLQWPARAQHSDQSVILYKALENIRETHRLLAVQDDLMAICGDQMRMALNTLEETKKLLIIIAAVDIIQTMSGPEQRAQAGVLLARSGAGAKMPKALLAELQKVAGVAKQPASRKDST